MWRVRMELRWWWLVSSFLLWVIDNTVQRYFLWRARRGSVRALVAWADIRRAQGGLRHTVAQLQRALEILRRHANGEELSEDVAADLWALIKESR